MREMRYYDSKRHAIGADVSASTLATTPKFGLQAHWKTFVAVVSVSSCHTWLSSRPVRREALPFPRRFGALVLLALQAIDALPLVGYQYRLQGPHSN